MWEGEPRVHARPRDRSPVVRTAVLSVLLHLLAILALWRFGDFSVPPPPTSPEVLWAKLEEPRSPPGPIVAPARETPPASPSTARHLSDRSRAVPRETRRPGPTQELSGGPPRAPRGSAPPPVGLPAPAPSPAPGVSSTDLLNRGSFSDYLTARTSVGAYNPAGTEDGEAVWLNTHEFKYVGYFMHLKEKIEAAWQRTRPYYDRERSGVLQMTILAGGELADVGLVESCGDRTLDLAVLDAIRQAAPFNPLPAAWGEDHVTIKFAFHYLLERRLGIF